ncbi:MAG: hypothetical protein MZV70_53600 [Desulfobacterales bacterium]|nr:hypothetical protein [Desulfobacterales bacterium]
MPDLQGRAGPAPRAEANWSWWVWPWKTLAKRAVGDEDVARLVIGKEIRRIMEGLGVSGSAVWEKMGARLVIEEK